MHVQKCGNRVVEYLTEKGILVHAHREKHSYPHCWRHKSPVIYRATPQWFIAMSGNGLLEAARNAVANEVTFTPPTGQNRLGAMLADRPDWCISRQRNWGSPITLFVHKQTQELHPRTNEFSSLSRRKLKREASMPGSVWIRPRFWVKTLNTTVR